MNGRTVLLYGRSLLLSGVAASLEQCPDLHIMRAGAWTEASRLLAEHTPDVLIFDLTNSIVSQIKIWALRTLESRLQPAALAFSTTG
jgi:DNA-binding NarL/FixJ family response regulator